MAEVVQTEMQDLQDPRGMTLEEKIPEQAVKVNKTEIPSKQESSKREKTAIKKFDIEEKENDEPDLVYRNEQFLGGQDNPVFTVNEETQLKERVIPPVTYIDFMPQLLLAAETKTEAPTYSKFP